MQPVKQQGEVSILEKINISSNYDNYEGSFATGDMVIVKDSEENIVCTSHLKEKDNIIKKDTEEILYDELKGFLERADSNSFESYIECIQKAVLSLHADKYRNQPRMISPYVDYSQTEKTKLYAALSYYFIERAMLTQICLCHCDIKSVFKVGMVSIDDVEFIHAYHLITDEDGNHHIFDSSFADLDYDGYNFLVGDIDDHTYQGILNDECGIEVHHEGVLALPEYKMVYNSRKDYIVPAKRESRQYRKVIDITKIGA